MQIHDARGSAKRLKSEVSGLRKQIIRESSKAKHSLAVKIERAGSLPRSPQKRHISVSYSYIISRLKAKLPISEWLNKMFMNLHHLFLVNLLRPRKT